MSAVEVQDRRRIPFFMVGKPDLAQLAKTCDSRLLPYARSVYFALLELANDQRSDEVAASRSELAQRGGVSVATLKRCVPVLRDAGLVSMHEVPGRPNIWALLSAEGGSSRPGGRLYETRGAALVEPGLNKELKEEEERTGAGTDQLALNGGGLDDSLDSARAVLAAWNDLTGQRRTSDGFLRMIRSRIRSHPRMTALHHRLVIERNITDPWWKGVPSPSVIYARDEVFENAVEKARSTPASLSPTRVTGTNYEGREE